MTQQHNALLYALIALLFAFAAAIPAAAEQKLGDDDNFTNQTTTVTSTPNFLHETSVLDEVRVREIVREEIALNNPHSSVETQDLPTPVSYDPEQVVLSPIEASETFRRLASEVITMYYGDGRQFTFNATDSTYRATNLPSTMCSASSLSASNAANQAAFVKTLNTLRSQLNACKWKVPKPSPLLAATTSSKAMASQANTWAQHLKTTESCGLVHSTADARTVSFKLDSGVQVTKAYTGENLAVDSICMSVDDTNNYNAAKAKYCAPGYLTAAATHLWWDEIKTYSTAGGGKFITDQKKLNSLNSNPRTQVGHWTQLAWGTSTVIAAATAECSKTSVQTFTCSPAGVGNCGKDGKLTTTAICYTWVTVGRFYKGGNYDGETPYSSKGVCNPSG